MGSLRRVSKQLATPANVVTILRICLIPVFVIAIIGPWPAWFPEFDLAETIKPWLAAAIFIVLSLTDTLDGYLARRRNEVTTFGTFVDPLADKMLVTAALLALIELQVLPSWVALIIICREFIVSGIRMIAASEGVVLAASWYGKAKTIFQMIAIVLFIIKDSFVPAIVGKLYFVSWFFMAIALVLTLVSMIDYFKKAATLFGFSAEASAQNRPSEALGADVRSSISPDSLLRLSETVVEKAKAGGITLATAESLTGGLLCSCLTDVPGSSACVRGGIVSYVDGVKMKSLGVDGAILDSDGAVSEACAREMASGARRELQADIGIALTGIAGPGGAEVDKPVGTVWLALAQPSLVRAQCQRFDGNREEVRLQAVCRALELLLDAMGT